MDVEPQPVVRLVRLARLVEQAEGPREPGLGTGMSAERSAADGVRYAISACSSGAPSRPSVDLARPDEHLGGLGHASEPDQRPDLAAAGGPVGPARRARREGLAQRPEDLDRLGVA